MKWSKPSPPATPQSDKPAGSRARARNVAANPSAKCLDPYVRWAELTEWRSVRRLDSRGLGTENEPLKRLRVLVQAPLKAKQPEILALLNEENWNVADVYRGAIPGTDTWSRHFTAEISVDKLDWLKGNPGGIRWELAMPFRDAESAARAVQMGSYGPTRAADAFRPAKDKLFKIDPCKVAEQGKLESAIAVIDFGCPFLNIAFAGHDENTTRVAALWDQGSAKPVHMKTPWSGASERMGYGRELSQSAMNEMLKAVRPNQAEPIMDEAEAYRRIDYLINYDDARRRIWGATHGSHVLDVAGGCIDPLTGEGGDRASKANLIFVQLPSLTGADSSGGSLSAQVLDAVRYVLDVCTAMARIVINLSYGSFAGPHDGSSLIEEALDELLEARKDNVAVVLGAGNARQANCHLRRIVRKNRSALLSMELPPGDFTDTFVEVWFKSTRGLHLLNARVRSGEGDWSESVALGGQVELTDVDDARRVALLSLDKSVPNGKLPLLLLALAPTARPADDDGPLAPTGRWEIELFLKPDPANPKALDDVMIEFDAWVERDDPGWLGVGVQPRFSDPHFGDADETLSSLATGARTIAVGGFRLDDGLPAAYSSTGTRKGAPVVYAACEESAAQPDVRAAATRSSDSLRMNGTSVAAPVFARRLYNWMTRVADDAPLSGGLKAAIKGVVGAEAKGNDLVRAAHLDELARFKLRRRPAPTPTSQSPPTSSAQTAQA